MSKIRKLVDRLLTSSPPVVQCSDKSPEELTELIKQAFANMGLDTSEKRQAWWDRQGIQTNDTLYISPEAYEDIRNWPDEQRTNDCDDGKCDDDLRGDEQE